MVSYFSHCLVHGLVVLHLHFNMPSTVSMVRLSLWTLLGCISDTGWWARGASDFMMILCTCENYMMLTGAHNSWTLLAWSIKSSWEFPHVHGSYGSHFIYCDRAHCRLGWAEPWFLPLGVEKDQTEMDFFGEASTIRISIWSINIHFLFPLSKEPSNTMQNFTNRISKTSANLTFTSLKNRKIWVLSCVKGLWHHCSKILFCRASGWSRGARPSLTVQIFTSTKNPKTQRKSLRSQPL